MKSRKKKLIPPPKTLFDDDGNITEDALRYIRNWSIYKENDQVIKGEFLEPKKENINALLNYVKKIWTHADWGFIFLPGNTTLSLHTGGNYNNELIMRYLKETWFHVCYWQMSKRGGHYYYEWQINQS